MRSPRHWQERGDAASPAPADALDGLLDEVRDLRLTLAADLATAAGAAEIGAAAIAGDILDGDRRELARFLRLADDQLRELERAAIAVPAEAGPVPAQARWRRRAIVTLPAIPLVGALAVSAAAVMGVLPVPAPATHQHTQVAAGPQAVVDSTFNQFKSVVEGDPSASQLVAAAAALHQQLNALINASTIDPSSASEIAQLLAAERELLTQHRPPGTQQVLAAASKLAAKLRDVALKTTAPSTTPRPADVPSASPSTKATKPAASASPSPSKSSTPAPKPTVTSSPSASPSSSQSGGTGQIPHIGN